jgi:RND family efflux transporter MFP subunit
MNHLQTSPTTVETPIAAMVGAGGLGHKAKAAFSPTHLLLLGVAGACLLFGLAGCSGGKSAAAPAAVPVHTAVAAAQEVTDWDTFTGHFEAVESVKLRPRVTGYIDSVRFAEGTEIKKGDVLFVIDQRPYRVQLERVQAEYARAKSQSELAATELARTQKLLDAHAVSQEEYDRRASERSQLQADLQAARAAVDAAQLNLEYTQVVAPISGRVSRAEVTTGNFVNAGETILTSVVSLDPIYVAFEGDEQTYLKYNQLAKSGERLNSRDKQSPVFIGLANETEFPHEARMNFLDNALNPETGTIRARALIANPEHLFTPGMLARVRLEGSGKYTATLVQDEAISTDQDRKYVMVVNAQNVAEYRAVELGGVFENQRVVRKGLNPGEQIIVGGLQRVRPGTPVQAEAAPVATNVSAKDSVTNAGNKHQDEKVTHENESEKEGKKVATTTDGKHRF